MYALLLCDLLALFSCTIYGLYNKHMFNISVENTFIVCLISHHKHLYISVPVKCVLHSTLDRCMRTGDLSWSLSESDSISLKSWSTSIFLRQVALTKLPTGTTHVNPYQCPHPRQIWRLKCDVKSPGYGASSICKLAIFPPILPHKIHTVYGGGGGGGRKQMTGA